MLLVRRLLAEGYGAGAINQLATARDNAELEALLSGGVQLTVTPANPALTFLQQIQQRQAGAAPPASAVRPATVPRAVSLDPNQPSAPTRWTRLEVLPGLKLHIREDFTYPSSPQEQQNLLQHIEQQLLTVFTNRRLSR